MRSSTETLIDALRILARDIQSEDGIANAAIWEAADRLAELDAENAALRAAIAESEEFGRKNGETLAAKVSELLRENAALREKFMFAESEIILLREEREELRVDKERLDYMEQHVDFVSWRFYGKPERLDLRRTIDRKMKEAQP